MGEKKKNSSPLDIYHLITEIEQKLPVDSIALMDGTKLWNLIRIILYFYPLKKVANNQQERISLKSIFYLIREGVKPLSLPQKKIDICGFSGTESRKFSNCKFYDIYMDPLYGVFDDKLTIFEWPDEQGYRRKYDNKIYSKNYVKMHFKIFSNALWNILIYRIFRKKKFEI